MWNLMNVVQVLAYMRYYADWPAMMLLIYEYMDNAITLKPISNPIMEWGQSKYQIANKTLSDEGLRDMGVQDTSLFKSLGVFLFVLLLMGCVLIVYGIAKLIARSESACAKKVVSMLRAKLFYSGFYRYMLQSNIKLTYTFWAFFLAAYSFESPVQSVKTFGFIVAITGLIIWPIFLA